jgi:hypothetical protein
VALTGGAVAVGGTGVLLASGCTAVAVAVAEGGTVVFVAVAFT